MRVQTFIAVTLCTFLVSTFLMFKFFTYVEVTGSSMEPTFSSGASALILKGDEPVRGEIVLFPLPSGWIAFSDEADIVLVKRVLAGPNDQLSYDGRNFFVNGVVQSTPQGACIGTPFQRTLGRGEIFVGGDNVNSSLDSRTVFCKGHSDYMIFVDDVKTSGRLIWQH